jgi:hypothetical protein
MTMMGEVVRRVTRKRHELDESAQLQTYARDDLFREQTSAVCGLPVAVAAQIFVPHERRGKCVSACMNRSTTDVPSAVDALLRR